MIILRFIFDSHFIYIYTHTKIVLTLFALYVFLLVLFVSIISTVIFVGEFSNTTYIYNINNDYCTIRSHREACTIAISQVLVQASLDHQNYVKYVPTVF